jgi:serine phosphatase RsbU (regulator of sigma subunit)
MRILEMFGGGATSGSKLEMGRRATDRLRALLDVSELSNVTSLEALLDRVGEAARSLFGTSHARVHLYDPDAGELWAPSPAGRIRVPAGEGPRAETLRTGHAVRGPEGPGGHLLCAPLRGVDGRVIGLLEVGPADSVTLGGAGLQAAALLADQASLALERFRLRPLARQAEGMRRDVELAHRLQAALQPGRASGVQGVEALGWSRPGSLTGGGCADYWRLPDGRLALFLGDASAYGAAGALIIAQVRALLRSLSEVRAEPDWLLDCVNARLHADVAPSHFVTAFVGCLGADGALQWCSAGQGPVYVRQRGTEEYQPVLVQVPPLGVDPGFRPEAGPQLRLGPGGRVAAVGAGIFDADNGAGQIFGPRRIKTVLDNTGGLPLDKVVELIRETISTWEGGRQAADDQSVLIAGLHE